MQSMASNLELTVSTEGASDAMTEAEHLISTPNTPLQDALRGPPGALSAAAFSITSKVVGHDRPSEMLDDATFVEGREVIVIGSSDEEDASESNPSSSMAGSSPSVEASSAASAASAAASAAPAEREDDHVDPVGVSKLGATSRPTCAKCQRVFPAKQRGAMVSHEKWCTGEKWVAPATQDRTLRPHGKTLSRARAQLLDSQGFSMQWLSANRSVAAASLAIAQDPERASRLTRAGTQAAGAEAAQGGEADGGLPYSGAPRNAAECLSSTMAQPALTWFGLTRSDASADGGAPAGAPAGAAVVKLPTWAIAVPRRGFAMVPGGYRANADGRLEGGMAADANVAICSRVGPEYQAMLPPFHGSATAGAASSSLGKGADEELRGGTSRLVCMETREIEREMAVLAAKHLTAAAYDDHPEFAYAAPPPAPAEGGRKIVVPALNLAYTQCGTCGRMFGNRGAMVSHEGTCATRVAATARVAATLPPAKVNRRLGRGKRASQIGAKRKRT